MRIIFYGLCLTTIVVGSMLATIVPPSAIYITGFIAGNFSFMFLHLANHFED